ITMFSFEWPSNAANVVISTSLDSAARVAQVCLKSYSLNSIMRIVDLQHGYVGVFPVGEDAGAFCNLHALGDDRQGVGIERNLPFRSLRLSESIEEVALIRTLIFDSDSVDLFRPHTRFEDDSGNIL